MMDCNKDVRSLRMSRFLDDIGMKEAIHDRHGSNAPATYIEGQVPINGLFVTCAISIREGDTYHSIKEYKDSELVTDAYG